MRLLAAIANVDMIHYDVAVRVSKLFAVSQSQRTNVRYVLGNRDARKEAAAGKCAVAYARHAVGNNDLRSTPAIANIDMIHYDVTVRTGKAFAGAQSQTINICYVFRNCDALEGAAAVKRPLSYTRHALRDCSTCE